MDFLDLQTYIDDPLHASAGVCVFGPFGVSSNTLYVYVNLVRYIRQAGRSNICLIGGIPYPRVGVG